MNLIAFPFSFLNFFIVVLLWPAVLDKYSSVLVLTLFTLLPHLASVEYGEMKAAIRGKHILPPFENKCYDLENPWVEGHFLHF